MTFAINKKLLEHDTYHLKLHMEQCKKEQCFKKALASAIKVGCNFVTGRIITSLTCLVIVVVCMSFIT